MNRFINKTAVISASTGLFALASAGAAAAADINVVNHSFEDITGETPFNEFTFGPLNGWDLYESFVGQTDGGDGPGYYIGTLNDQAEEFITGVAPDGVRVGIAFNNANTGGGGEYGLQQTISTDQLQAFTRYTLQVEIINIDSGTAISNEDFNLAGFPGYRVALMAGGVEIDVDDNSLAGSIIEGGHATSTIIFETGATHAQLGQDLGIRLVNLNVVDTTDATTTAADLEVDFDNVRLSTEVVPEPGTLALLGLGGLLIARRRRG
ncbi:MAG: PEP-CTERM sorting domain-containing protein [Phycisphaeraceae bacterium]|nr:PEP-CTERM sorting domain-containing protein [Phycisphaeraceae bacterium]